MKKKLPVDKKTYFQLLDEAANDPNCCGVILSKKRRIGVDAVNKEYASMKLKKGESIRIVVNVEDQSYIDKWVSEMKNYGLDVQYRKLYSTVFMSKGKFIGYEIFVAPGTQVVENNTNSFSCTNT